MHATALTPPHNTLHSCRHAQLYFHLHGSWPRYLSQGDIGKFESTLKFSLTQKGKKWNVESRLTDALKLQTMTLA